MASGASAVSVAAGSSLDSGVSATGSVASSTATSSLLPRLAVADESPAPVTDLPVRGATASASVSPADAMSPSAAATFAPQVRSALSLAAASALIDGIAEAVLFGSIASSAAATDLSTVWTAFTTNKFTATTVDAT